MDVPTFQINENENENIVNFIYKHERILKEYGAIKIQPNIRCKFALKKRPKTLILHPISRQIVKINSNNLIYSIQNTSDVDVPDKRASIIKDECTFWLDLSYLNNGQRPLNISFSSNNTFFYQKLARKYFDIHSVPNQSLLRIAEKKVISECVPCVKRAHGAGAIFPLSCTEQNLFSIDYHHEGGIHHWYIIPNCERKSLQTVIDQEKLSICLDHGQIVIDPSFLDKHHIRYHRITQCPNEFVVLSAGTLSQSFVEDASWSESIVFALPSWIEDDHANHSKLLCQCNIFNNSLSETIDITRFNRELIRKYTKSYLGNTTNDKSIVLKDQNDSNAMTTTTTTLNRVEDKSLNDQTMMSTSMPLAFIPQQLTPSCDSIPSLLTTSSLSNYLCEDNQDRFDINNAGAQYQARELETSTEATQQITTTSASDHENFIGNCGIDNPFIICEELMGIPFDSEESVPSIFSQENEYMDTTSSSTQSFDTYPTTVNEQSHTAENRVQDSPKNDRKTLFVSGLKKDVCKDDVRRLFPGCSNVIIKRYRTTPHLKYALVTHCTSQTAEINRRRPINFHLLGPQCRIEYAGDSASVLSRNQSCDRKTIVVQRIPSNVSEADLYYLFPNCQILKYYPAVIVPATALMTAKTTSNRDTLLGEFSQSSSPNINQEESIIELTKPALSTPEVYLSFNCPLLEQSLQAHEETLANTSLQLDLCMNDCSTQTSISMDKVR
ncbi:unnamed protein product [Adineta steineri]|uniref:JmjC domain-containing protein n=1 Tax=Adineta steineri TaxID=433720 RepID=A0A813VT54_9BILA|nr:unnamed protein product [Adineta steineri]CAF3773268.1 unnamed protein product [Adineta steineri]